MNATPSPSSALFAGQRALITGGTQGIGKAVAMRLARQGAHVYLNFSRNLAAAEEAIAAFRAAGHSAQLAQADLSDPAAIDAMLQSIAADGPLDILVCNAAYQEKVPFLDTSLALMQQTFAVNVFGNVHIVQSVGKRMVELGAKGRIVVCTSPHGTYVYNESFAYDISKAALNHMVRGAALALIAHGIRVNAVDIGWTMTPGERRWFTPQQQIELSKGIPIGRPAEADEIAAAVEFLCSPDAGYVVGSIFLVDGGFCLKPNPDT